WVGSRNPRDGRGKRRRGPHPAARYGRAPRPVRAPASGAMSTFFKALERAEQERALRRPTTPPELANEPRPAAPEAVSSRPSPAAPETGPSQAPQSFFRPPRKGERTPEENTY